MNAIQYAIARAARQLAEAGDTRQGSSDLILWTEARCSQESLGGPETNLIHEAAAKLATLRHVSPVPSPSAILRPARKPAAKRAYTQDCQGQRRREQNMIRFALADPAHYDPETQKMGLVEAQREQQLIEEALHARERNR